MNNNASVPESFRKIQTDQYELPLFFVSQMLPTGVHLFAGSPKIGKSWLALWLCDKVAKGEKVWEFDTQQCTVLYIALEDTKSTLHFRTENITAIASEKAFAITSCSSLSDGLLNEIDSFVAIHPDTGLVVIDTLQLVRDTKEKHSYAGDYVELHKFVEYAQEKDIAILLVHHLRKMPDSDPINMVSGSTGLLGSVDSILVLEKEARTENRARLYITGRRVRDQVLRLEFEENTNVWRFVEFVTNTQSQMDKLIKGIQNILQTEKRFMGTPTELTERIKAFDADFDIPANAMSRLLNEHSISLRKSYGIYYSRERSAVQRLIVLSQLKDKNSDDVG
jgi:RecA-family ATPase